MSKSRVFFQSNYFYQINLDCILRLQHYLISTCLLNTIELLYYLNYDEIKDNIDGKWEITTLKGGTDLTQLKSSIITFPDSPYSVSWS